MCLTILVQSVPSNNENFEQMARKQKIKKVCLESANNPIAVNGYLGSYLIAQKPPLILCWNHKGPFTNYADLFLPFLTPLHPHHPLSLPEND